MSATWDPAAAAAFYDAYGDREWLRFENGVNSSGSLATHLEHLRRFVGAGDRVLDIGCGPGRFTIELARLGASVVAADISPGQLELHRAKVAEAGAEAAVEARHVLDVADLSLFPDDSFDVAVCFGGALSYLLDRAPVGVAELVRVTRPGGRVLVSAMSLIGTLLVNDPAALIRLHGRDGVRRVVRSGIVLPEDSDGHLTMKLYRWRELEALLVPHGRIVAASAAGMFRDDLDGDNAPLVELELELAAEPGAVDTGQHVLAVLEVTGP